MAEKNSRVSISFELLRYITLYYLTVAILLTFIQVFFEYKDIKTTIDSNINDLFSSFDKSLTNSIWEFNESQTQTILKGINKSPSVLGVKLMSPTGAIKYNITDGREDAKYLTNPKIQDLGILNPHYLFQYSHKLYKETGLEKKEHVGNLIIYSGNKIILDNLSSTILYILITSFIKTISLWTILFIFLRKNIKIPLNGLIKKIKTLDPQSPKEIRLNSTKLETEEIHQIITSFNSLITELVKYKEILQAIVNNTTEQLKEKSNEVRELVGKLNSTQEQVLNQEKLKNLNIISSKISSELENPILKIKEANQRLEKTRHGLSNEAVKDLDIIFMNSQIIEHKITGINQDSNNNERQMTNVNLSQLVTEFFKDHKFYDRINQENCHFELSIQNDINISLYKREFKNLLKILFEYSIESLLEKSVSNKNTDYIANLSVSARKSADGKILMTFYNNGIGKIEDQDSLSLNLYLANEIILKHDGQLQINSEEDTYTEIQIYLPF